MSSHANMVDDVGEKEVTRGRLADFLQSQKEAFLGDLKAGSGKGWVLAMGNEAGGKLILINLIKRGESELALTIILILLIDLDTIASSVAYATLSSLLLAEHSLPLILTPSSLLRLRPENILALNASLLPPSVLLHEEELPVPASKLAGMGIKFALVDHNTLLPQFRPSEGFSADQDPVAAIIDHHEDEHSHSTAPLRLIKFPTGSCASLVTDQFSSQWASSISGPAGIAGGRVPGELATLLMSSILIDTGGLKAGEGSKTTESDRQAAEFLWPISKFAPGSNEAVEGGSSFTKSKESVTTESLSQGIIPSALSEWKDQLFTAKTDVQGLSSKELLLRDYKSYTLPLGTPSFSGGSDQSLRVGLSTVPYGLHDWLTRGPVGDDPGKGWTGLMAAIDTYMTDNDLDVEGVLTTFKESKHDGGKAKGKREVILAVRTRAGQDLSRSKKIFDSLVRGMEYADVLELKPWGGKKESVEEGVWESKEQGRYAAVWKQGNAGATRKQVAPLVKEIIGGIEV